MPGPAFLRGDDVTLRTIEEEDLDFTRRWGNDPRIRHGMTTTDPRNRHAAEQRHERHSESDDGVGLLACVDGEGRSPSGSSGEPNDGEPVGRVVLFDIDDVHGNAEMACWVVPEHHGEGYATEATALLIDHALCERRLHKVVGRAIETNEGSRRVFEKLGMEKEGHQRDQKFVDGEHLDVVRYAVLADEWERAYPQ